MLFPISRLEMAYAIARPVQSQGTGQMEPVIEQPKNYR